MGDVPVGVVVAGRKGVPLARRFVFALACDIACESHSQSGELCLY